MLRNVHRCRQQLLHIEWSSRGSAHISTGCGAVAYAKANSIKLQSKIMSKLVGYRVSGSKKRWYPNNDINTSNSSRQRNAEMIHSAHIKSTVGSAGGGKSTTRRMVVLNKLFMKHITDLLATGEVSEAILGRGLQVTCVKISPDFSSINVYWLGCGEALSDALLENELQRCSGYLRHELSQLMLMGEVPRVKFTREKKLTNIAHVEELLRTIDFGRTDETADSSEEAPRVKCNLVANMMQREFFGKSLIQEVPKGNAIADGEAKEDEFPEMRQDVFGLDHRQTMTKIMTKMRKSQQAWEQHAQKDSASAKELAAPSESIGRIQQKLAEAAENAERFEKFLAKRREHKNTPERKRHDRASHWVDERAEKAILEVADDAVLTPAQRHLLEAEDYLHEEDDKSESNKG